ncbi:T9SS type A sorting domain-containing protein [Parabacteroides sp.]
MKKHYTLYNIVKATRLLSLGALMAFGLSFWGWGQQQLYTIEPQEGKTFPQKDVPTLVDTIYLENGQHTLQVANYRYYWYMRWYRKNSEGETNIQKLASLRAYDRIPYLSQSNNDAPSYFWHHGMLSYVRTQENASKIYYTSDGSVDSVFCDLSFYVDGLGIDPSGDTYTEPTISKRYKFYIKPASEMRTRLSSLQDGAALDTIYMTVPQSATKVNLQMDMAPENYFWSTRQGNSFSITGVTNASSDGKLIQLSNAITQKTTVKVYAQDGNNQSPCLAMFVLTPQENSGFLKDNSLELLNNEERNPDKNDKKYAQIGVVDFDYDGVIDRNGLTADNNMSENPVDPSRTTYSFANPLLPWINQVGHMQEDAYGLYRSANVPDISERESHGLNWISYTPNTFNETFKSYGWYYAKDDADEELRNRELFDRTYHNENKQKCGSFYYVNASTEAGRIVTVPINGTLCSNTELTVVAWVADITDASTPPNVNLVLHGMNPKTGASGRLHTFSSGDMRESGGNSRECAQWFQLCYKITLSKEMLASYTDFEVELQNNAPNTNGADYAIDDIRIYKTLPNISVRRESACDYSTLVVSADYNTLMRNMGWSENSNVLANVSLKDPNVRKYRYGIMGDDPYTSDPHEHVGNMYYSVTETNLDEPIDYDPSSSDPVPGTRLEDWVTLNKELLEKGEASNNPVLTNLSKSMRVAIPTDLNLPDEGEEEHGVVPQKQEDAAMNEIVLNLRALNDFLSDTQPKQIYDDEGKPDGTPETIWSAEELKNAGIKPEELKEYLKSVSTITIVNNNITGSIKVSEEQINNILNDNAANQLYEDWLIKVYDFLELPRIRCPWQRENADSEKILCLGAIDVNNTDLKYKGEKGPDDEVGASGQYHVVVFNAEQVHGHAEDGGSVVNFMDDCLLHSPFTVQPSSSFAINTEMTHDGKGCLGSITRIKGNLLVDEIDVDGNIVSEEPIPFEEAYGDKGSYTFDWFIGTLEEYDRYSASVGTDEFVDLRGLIKAFRDTRKGSETSYFTKEMIMASDFYTSYKEDAELLIGLLGDATTETKLIIGNGNTESNIRWPECVVAMPYVPDITDSDPSQPGVDGKRYQFCVEPLELPLETNAAPALSVGFPNIDYQDMSVVPLRLGLRNINDASGKGISLNDIPIQENIAFGSNGSSLGLPYGEDSDVIVYLNDNTPDRLKPIADLTALKATKSGGKLSIQFRNNIAQFFKEGKDEYRLYIPFGEYSDEGATQQIEGSCGGYAELTLKIVPEYLTWKSAANAVWYNDDNWSQSTKEELYMGDKDATDANGDDDVTDAFTPLYFTKITIPDGEVLNLENEKSLQLEEEDNRLNLGETTTIQYDMAVNNTGEDNAIKVVPYYGNKVEQIYFKPNAKLMNQHYLDYGKAWVEFEIDNTEKRWMTSPLQDVYAGDMYAPNAKGKQETAAFTDINYTKDTYSRWTPAFYQKVWNKAIEYATDETGNTMEPVETVKSNWSIEYNDVRVPYKIGKGFYLSVEDVPTTNGGDGTALVRLPKADAITDYEYEAKTKAAVLRADEDYLKTNSGKLVELTNDSYSLALENVDGDETHFLVGNPFMTYLDMKKFLSGNANVLANKYWTLENGSSNAVVGTPDVDFEGESTTGTVEPMQAFFVELKDGGTTKEITFTPAMMSATAIPASGTSTKSYFATSPALTITAERGETKSVATLRTSDKADNSYNAAEDAIVLLDSELDAPMAYTVAGSKAAQVNAVKSIRNIGLGVYNDAGDEATLTIEGLSRLPETLYLYDAHTLKSVKLEGDSYSLQVSGDSHGRYFLRDSDLGTELENTISIYSAQRGKVIVSSLRPVKDIKVVTLSGSQVRQFSVNTTQYTFNLPAGIYMIYASDGEREHTEKVIVR